MKVRKLRLMSTASTCLFLRVKLIHQYPPKVQMIKNQAIPSHQLDLQMEIVPIIAKVVRLIFAPNAKLPSAVFAHLYTRVEDR